MRLASKHLSGKQSPSRALEAAASSQSLRAEKRDLMALGIAAAAIILFLGTGGKVVSQMARSWASESSGGVDPTVVSTLMLNVALIIFIMRFCLFYVGDDVV